MKTIIHPGTIQTLRVHSIEGKFALLGDENKQVPLPKIQFPGMAEEGAEVTVFTYFDNTRNLVASTQLPTLQVGQVGSFKVKNLNNLGAFIDIGSERDILIPFPEQREELEEGRWVLVTLQYDDLGQRIFASTKINAYFKNYDIPYERGDEVDLIIGEKLELGRRVIIDGKFVGFLFKQEMLRTYGEGDKVKGYIRKIEGREITVSTQKEGQELIDEAAERILEVLKSNKGYLRLNDDSDPEDIKRYLTMSKKTFKKAAGQLYKQQLITLTDRGIRLGGSGEIQEGDGTVKPLRKRITQVVAERNTVGGSPRRNARDFQEGEMDRPRKSRQNDDDEQSYSGRSERHSQSSNRRDGERRSNNSERGERSSRSFERRDGERRSNNSERGERSSRSSERRDGERISNNSERGERSSRNFERRDGERRSNNSERGERSSRNFERRDGERRSNNSERGERSSRSFERRDGERRSNNGERGERNSRSFERRDGERRSNNSERGERNSRSFERRDGERRSNNSERGERNSRSFERRDGERRSNNSERGERNSRSFERRNGERRSNNSERGERNSRSFERRDGERRSNNSERGEGSSRSYERRDGERRSNNSERGEKSTRSFERRDSDRNSDQRQAKSRRSIGGDDNKPKKKGKTPDRSTKKNPNKGKPKK